jgi:DnaJ domain
MEHLAALRAAIDVLQVPSRLQHTRSRSLPVGVSLLLEIAAGNEASLKAGALAVGSTEAITKSAAIFFIEQVLLSGDSNSYRVLGANRDDSREHLRRNMALLMHWLHPDRANADRAVLTHRVANAWENLKTEEQRARYDSKLADAARRVAGHGSLKPKRTTAQAAKLQRERLVKASVKIPFLQSRGARTGSRSLRFGLLRGLRHLIDKLQR